MKPPPNSLSDALRDWQVTPPRDAHFRHDVWARINAHIPASWPAYLRGHAVAWMLVTVLTVSAAALTGHATAQAKVRADREAMIASYLVDLDPRVQAILNK